MAQRVTARVTLADIQAMRATGTLETMLDLPKCAVCNKVEFGESKLLQCARCKKTKYCKKSCQEHDWPAHKAHCKAQNYILKIDLDPENITNPYVSRTLSCPASVTFEALHSALQVAFGWSTTHTYDFKIKDPNAESMPEFDPASYISRIRINDQAMRNGTPIMDGGPRQNFLRIIEKKPTRMCVDAVHGRNHMHSQTPEIDSKKIKLSKVFENQEYEGAPIEYEYDFGDRWTHDITVIGRAGATTKFKCLDGEGHGVAEDVGSSDGWQELKQAYKATTPNEEQKKKREWFENRASNRDRRGLGDGRERTWNIEAINLNLRN